MGTPLDELYTRANGTSMATPHVAGAAAIVLQQNTDLNPAELKAALSSTAAPNPALSVYEQGGGLVDIAAALAAPVVANPAPLNLGFFPYGEEHQPVSMEVTYTNRTDAEVTLDLTLDVAADDGTAVPSSALSVEPATVTVPVGDVAIATVALDTEALSIGSYGGYLVASGEAGTVRTPVGFTLEGEMYDIVIEGIARDGRPARGASGLYVADAYNTELVRTPVPFVNGEARLRVPPSTYWVGGSIRTYDGNDVTVQDRVYVGVPSLDVTEDVSVVLDAREAGKVEFEVPDHPDATPFGHQGRAMLRFRAEQTGSYGVTAIGEWSETFVLASEPIAVGEFEFTANVRLAEPRMLLEVVAPASIDVFPRRLAGPPPLDDDMTLPLVFAGSGATSDYEGLDVTGAAVLTHRSGPDLASKEATARSNGAAALIVMNNASGWFSGSMGAAAELPGIAISGEAGDQLLDLLDDGEVTVRVAGSSFSPYMYELVQPEADAFPQGGHYVAEREKLARVDNAFHGMPGHLLGEYRAVWRPNDVVGAAQRTETPAAAERVEYVSPGDTLYRQSVAAMHPSVGNLQERDTLYEVGDVRELAWYKSPMRMALFEPAGPRNPGDPVTRTGNQIRFIQLEWWDSSSPANYGARQTTTDTIEFRAYRDGVQFGTANRPRVTATVGPESATYRFETDQIRSADWWRTSTSVSTAWTFVSEAPAAGETETLPLLVVDYDTELDLTNTAPHPRDRQGPATLDLAVRHQVGADPLSIDSVQVWVSYDDGDTWNERPVRDLSDGNYRAILDSQDGEDTSGLVSIRAEVWDVDGNGFEQEVIRAWRLPDR
jgi:hypothetical protein